MLYDAFLYISWWFHHSILKPKLRISFPIVLILSGDIIVLLTLTRESLSVSQMQPSLSRNTHFSGSLHAFLHCLPLPEEVSLFPSCYSISSSPSVSPKSPVGPWSFSSTCVFLEHSQTDILLGISLSTLCFDTQPHVGSHFHPTWKLLHLSHQLLPAALLPSLLSKLYP